MNLLLIPITLTPKHFIKVDFSCLQQQINFIIFYELEYIVNLPSKYYYWLYIVFESLKNGIFY